MSASPEVDAPDPPSIFLIGDSISIDYHSHLAELAAEAQAYSYSRKGGLELARKDLDHPQGANGGDSRMLLAFLREQIRNGGLQADFVAANCGLHDIKTDPKTGTRQVPLAEYKANLQALVQTVRGAGMELLWITTTPVDEIRHRKYQSAFHRFEADLDAYNKAAREIMAANNVPVIDLFAFTQPLSPDLFRDHVHFKREISHRQAEWIHAWFLNFLKERKTANPH